MGCGVGVFQKFWVGGQARSITCKHTLHTRHTRPSCTSPTPQYRGEGGGVRHLQISVPWQGENWVEGGGPLGAHFPNRPPPPHPIPPAHQPNSDREVWRVSSPPLMNWDYVTQRGQRVLDHQGSRSPTQLHDQTSLLSPFVLVNPWAPESASRPCLGGFERAPMGREGTPHTYVKMITMTH